LTLLALTSIARPSKIAWLFTATLQRSAWIIEKALSKISPPSLKSPVVTLHQVTTVISTNQPRREVMKHSIALPTIAAAALFLVFASFTPVALAQPQSLLTHHVREVTLNGQAPSVGRLPANQSMRIDIVLPVRDGLDSFLQEIYDPSSPSYKHYLTVEEFTQRFGPSQEHWNALVHFAKTNGLTVTGGSRDALDLHLTGSVANIETAFHVRIGLYHDPVANRDFFAPDREPTIDLPFQLWHITGLDNYSIPRRALAQRNSSVKPHYHDRLLS
jgi:subtilase family serine protease